MAVIPFTIDEDIALARTPPREAYTSEAVFALARERVLLPAWHYAGTSSDMGPVRRVTLAGASDQPILFTREDGVTRCFANVCTHRGARLCQEDDTRIRCPYHGRTFGLDGKLRRAPGFEDARSFPEASDDLAPIACGSLGPLLFARPSGDVPFDAWMGPVRDRLSWLPFDALKPDPAATTSWTIPVNWALYCDNYLEGFHIPFVHPGLNRVLDPDAYATELLPWGTLQIGIGRAGQPGGVFDRTDRGRHVAAYWAWLFPATMLNVYPWGLSVNVVAARAPAETVVHYLAFTWSDAPRDLDATQVELEDQAILREVQAGLASRAYGRGRYAPRHEAGVHHFHRLLARALFGA